MIDAAALQARLKTPGMGAGLESAAAADLGAERQERSLDALSDLVSRAGPAPETEGLVDAARAGFAALAGGGLKPEHRVALEAIILADGSRPAVPVKSDRIDAADPRLGPWAGDVTDGAALLRAIARGCGRITLAGRCIGTGFAVGEGLIATNRHVAQAIAQAIAEGPNLRLRQGVSFDLKAEEDAAPDPAQSLPVAEIAWAGPDPIPAEADPSKLDLALLRLEGGIALPALPLAEPADPLPKVGDRIAVMGHPAAPPDGVEEDRVLFRLFRGIFDVKRFAPGLVTRAPGALPGDSVPPRGFGHDASTLGGNSGSCILALDGTFTVMGLHFGGRQRQVNMAHAIALIRDRLP